MIRDGDSPNLDYLRSIAVLAVAASHLYVQCGDSRNSVFMHNLGVGGVCFFFVHTCLVLLKSMSRTKSMNLFRNFYIRRAFRIYPLCWTSIFLVLVTGWTNVPNATIADIGWLGVVVNLALLQNILRFPSVVGPLWSLPWEVQMYVLLPALFLFLKKYRRSLSLAILMWCAATVLALAVTTFHFPRAFHAAIIPPLFLGGVVAYHFVPSFGPRIPTFVWLLFVPGLLVLRCLLLRGDLMESARNVGVSAVVCLCLGTAIPLFKEIDLRFLSSSVHLLAKYSYGVYLFHVPVLILVFKHLGSLPLLLKVCIFVGITSIVTVVSYSLIEHPMIQVGKRLASWFDRTEIRSRCVEEQIEPLEVPSAESN
jgi:peptidoglycan/LPS O-acetylase OafA/YrhL